MKFSILLALAAAAAPALGSLNEKALAKGKHYFGNIADPNTLSDTNVQNILKSDFGMITPEYSMKWEATESVQGQFNFADADATMDFASSNGQKVRGHTLIWYASAPAFLTGLSKDDLTAAIKSHISTVVKRYAGRIYAWDVVNEIFEDSGEFRQSVFYTVLGEDFVDIAFRAASEADPAAMLYINEYNLEWAGPKIEAMIALVKRLKDRGVPIDGVGSQTHLELGKVDTVKDQLQYLADETGLDVAITELDIRIPLDVTEEKKQQQKTEYQTVVSACMAVESCVGVSLWGVSDKNSWVDQGMPGYDAPLLWDDNFAKKPAYDGVDAALN
ncbi:glycosyl hydrolase family 10 protein [Geopyxis carbonaria]|nr:glycosyl hydrolase family 10 protein [Geopyxis carbonaria]